MENLQTLQRTVQRSEAEQDPKSKTSPPTMAGERKTFIENTEHFVLLNVPAGKPTTVKQGKGNSTLKYEVDPGQKGITCFFEAALKCAFLEDNHSDQQKNPKRIAALAFCKAMSTLKLNDLEGRRKASYDFLTSLNLDPQEALQKFTQLSIELLEKLGHKTEARQLTQMAEQNTLLYREHMLFKAARIYINKVFKLETTSWKPGDNIETLLELLQNEQTPIVFNGLFGQHFYTQDSFEHAHIGHYEVRAWPKDSHKGKSMQVIQATGGGHVVTVIGAQRIPNSEQEYVYFIDPTDTSDPKKNIRILYKISYKQFRQLCLDGNINSLLAYSDPKLAHLDYGHQRKEGSKKMPKLLEGFGLTIQHITLILEYCHLSFTEQNNLKENQQFTPLYNTANVVGLTPSNATHEKPLANALNSSQAKL